MNHNTDTTVVSLSVVSEKCKREWVFLTVEARQILLTYLKKWYVTEDMKYKKEEEVRPHWTK